MKKYLLIIFCIIAFWGCNNDEHDTPRNEDNLKTVLMYLVADNNISYDLYSNIVSVEKGLQYATTPGEFVFYWDGGTGDRKVSSTPILFKYIVDGKGGVSERIVLKNYADQNSCSQEVVEMVLNDTKKLAPAKSYGLIMGSHATGWLPANTSRTRSFGDDNGQHMEIPVLTKALIESDLYFDYILMDACLMSQIEVVYELRNTTDYLIVSPAEVLSQGFPYENITKHLLSHENKEKVAISIAQEYIQFYKNQTYKWATIAVVKTSELDAFASCTRSVFNQYSDRMDIFNSSLLNFLQRDCGYARSSLSNSTYDFCRVLDTITDSTIPAYWLEQLNKVVIFKDYVNEYFIVNINPVFYSGIGCYLPNSSFTKWNAYYQNMEWYKAAGLNNYW